MFTFIPDLILRIDSETTLVHSLKNMAAAVGVPGAFVGFIAASGRIDDIDVWVTNIANFVFYFTIAWLLLKGYRHIKTRET